MRGWMLARLAWRSHTTGLQNRIHAALKRYGSLDGEPSSDLFGKKQRLLKSLPGVGKILVFRCIASAT